MHHSPTPHITVIQTCAVFRDDNVCNTLSTGGQAMSPRLHKPDEVREPIFKERAAGPDSTIASAG